MQTARPMASGISCRVWHMGASRVALSAHVTLARGEDWPTVLGRAQRMLAADFAIDHVTLQPSWPAAMPAKRVIPLVPVAARRPPSDG